MAQPRSGKKQGKSILEKRRLKQDKRATQVVAGRKRDRLSAAQA